MTKFWTMFVIAFFSRLGFGQERPQTPSESETRAERKQILDEMRSFVADVKIYERDGADRQPVSLVEKPVLFVQDAARENHHGSVWLWGRTGRPKAIIEVYWRTKSKVEDKGGQP